MTHTSNGKRTTFVSLRVKLLLGFTLLFTGAFAGLYYWFYTFATDTAMDRISGDLRDTLVAAAEQVDGDELVALANEGTARPDGFTDDPRYWSEVEWLETVHHIEPRAFAYTFVKGPNPNEVIFITDVSSVLNPSRAATFRYPFAAEDNPDTDVDEAIVITQGLQQTTLYLDIYTDQWGSWVSGYTPVLNARGEKVGALGIDFEADYVLKVQKAVKNGVLPAILITYPLLFAMIYVLSRVLMRPVIALTRTAERIGEGDYNQDLAYLTRGRFPDEIDTLAKVFEIMVGKVRQREETLKKQVNELRIMIDESKRQKQVEEIVDTDFFRDLQQKARAMRAEFAAKND